MTVKVQLNTTTPERQLANMQSSNAIARDPNGRLWAVYKEDGSWDTTDIIAAYSDDDGLTWTEETVVSNAYAEGLGGFAILIDSNNVPIVLYIYNPFPANKAIRYVDKSGGSWGTPETVITTGTTNTYGLTACIDSGDNIHIAYAEGAGGAGAIYVKGVSGSWGGQEIVAAGGSYPCIAVDSSNQPYVLYSITGYVMMRYKTTIWQTAETVFDGDNGKHAIALDSNDDVYAAFVMDQGTGVYSLYYNKRTSGSWGTTTLVASPSSGEDFYFPLMTIDTRDNVYFIYHEASGDNVIYYKKLTSGSLGEQQTLTEDITPPSSANHSLYAGLWAKYPSSCRIGAVSSPTIVALDYSTGTYILYYIRAENPATVPTVTTDPATSVSQTTATKNGTLDDDGDEDCEVRFQYGETAAYGLSTAWQSGKTTGDTFEQVVRGLMPSKTYHFRAQARNSAGTANGADRTFQTTPLSAAAHQALGKSYPLGRAEV